MSGSFVGVGEMRERVTVRRLMLDEDAGRWSWETERSLCAKVEEDDRSNLFSKVGIGARGVTFTLRENRRLDLHRSFLWRGKHCFLTAITDAPNRRMTVKAAVVELVECTARTFSTRLGAGNRPQAVEGPAIRFPGVVTEKYLGYERKETHARLDTTLVLVTPKPILLEAGDQVTLTLSGREAVYNVRQRHELDPYKNEYEINWSRDV